MNARVWLSALAVLITVARPAPAAAPRTLLVFAAASLTDVLPRVAAAWAKQGGARMQFSFDSSSRLARQIEAGAPADVFFSADEEWMDYLDKSKKLAPGTRRDLLGNKLAIILPAAARGSSFALASPADLKAATFQRIALAGPTVPAGKYARAALAKAGVWDEIASKVVNGDSVRTALGWVARGEADVGIVYATDARVQPKVKMAYTFPAEAHPPITYPAAAVARAGADAQATLAVRFLNFCTRGIAKEIFLSAGFAFLP